MFKRPEDVTLQDLEATAKGDWRRFARMLAALCQTRAPLKLDGFSTEAEAHWAPEAIEADLQNLG